MNAEERLGRVLKLLHACIGATGLRQHEVDARIGHRRGYLSHVLQRRLPLKVIDLFRTLEALQVDPWRFFRVVLSRGGGGGLSKEELALLVSVQRPETAVADDSELVERVRQAVRAILDDLSRGSS